MSESSQNSVVGLDSLAEMRRSIRSVTYSTVFMTSSCHRLDCEVRLTLRCFKCLKKSRQEKKEPVGRVLGCVYPA